MKKAMLFLILITLATGSVSAWSWPWSNQKVQTRQSCKETFIYEDWLKLVNSDEFATNFLKDWGYKNIYVQDLDTGEEATIIVSDNGKIMMVCENEYNPDIKIRIHKQALIDAYEEQKVFNSYREVLSFVNENIKMGWWPKLKALIVLGWR